MSDSRFFVIIKTANSAHEAHDDVEERYGDVKFSVLDHAHSLQRGKIYGVVEFEPDPYSEMSIVPYPLRGGR